MSASANRSGSSDRMTVPTLRVPSVCRARVHSLVAERRPADQQPRRSSDAGTGAHDDVRHIEHGRAAVAVVGEEKAARRRGLALRRACGDRHRQRYPRQRGERAPLGGERGERGVGWMNRVAQPLEDSETDAVAAGLRHREAAGGDDDGVGLDRRPALLVHTPSARLGHEVGHQGIRQEANAPFARRAGAARRARHARGSRRERACRTRSPRPAESRGRARRRRSARRAATSGRCCGVSVPRSR